MVFLFVLFFVTLYLYLVRNVKCNGHIIQLIIWFPALVVFYIPLALQKGVGTDYESYYELYYMNNSDLELYLSKGEFVFLKILEFSNYLGHPQFIFAIFSFFITIVFFMSLSLLKKQGFSEVLVFFIFFTCTGIYHNSFNTLRQNLVISFLPILIYWVFQKKYITFFATLFSLSFVHKSAFLYVLLIIFDKFIKNSKKIFLVIFLFSIFFYLINQKNLVELFFKFPIVQAFTGNYIYYLESDFFSPGNVVSILTKLYYVPFFLLFWVLYFKDSSKKNEFFDFLIKNWVVTCFMILQVLYISIYYRLWNMFSFLYIFPIYFVVDYYVKRKDMLFIILILTLLLIPYCLKVLVFPSAEYKYAFFNFIF